MGADGNDLQWKNVEMLKSVKDEKNDIDVNGVSLLCQFHLVDEHTRHESLIETSLVKVLCVDNDLEDKGPLC